MNFLDGGIKQIRTRVVHKSCFYTLIGELLYFGGRSDILHRAVRKVVIPNLLQEFHEGFCMEHFAGQITVEKFLRCDIIRRQCSRTIFIITNVARCAKRLRINLR